MTIFFVDNGSGDTKLRETDKWKAFIAAYPRQAKLFFEEDAPIKTNSITGKSHYYKLDLFLKRDVKMTEELHFTRDGQTAYARFTKARREISKTLMPFFMKIFGTKGIPSGKQLRDLLEKLRVACYLFEKANNKKVVVIDVDESKAAGELYMRCDNVSCELTFF